MSLKQLFQNRVVTLSAGVVLGALLLSALPTSAARQGDDDPPDPPTTVQPQPLIPAFGTADSNRNMIAVTGIDVTGSSILFLVDTQGKHLCVYQANGGAPSMQGLKLVGARRIDLDLALDGYNDKSEYSVGELEKKFSEIGQGAPVTR